MEIEFGGMHNREKGEPITRLLQCNISGDLGQGDGSRVDRFYMYVEGRANTI